MIYYDESFYDLLPGLFSQADLEQVAVLTGQPDGIHYRIKGLIPAVNECCDPENRFFISNRQLQQMAGIRLQPGEQILGILHTHPSHLPAAPSQADLENCRHPVNAVYHSSSRRLVFFDVRGPMASACERHTTLVRRLPIFVPA